MHSVISELLSDAGTDRSFAEQVSAGLKNSTLDLYNSADDISLEWEAINDLCEGVLENKWKVFDLEECVFTLLKLVEFFPSYTASSMLYRAFIYQELDPTAKDILWNGILTLISGPCAPTQDAVEYALWVDFFEDQSTCQEAWLELTKRASGEVLSRLLIVAGPMPYELKHPFYVELAKDPEKHNVLAESLVCSINDVYGKVDYYCGENSFG